MQFDRYLFNDLQEVPLLQVTDKRLGSTHRSGSMRAGRTNANGEEIEYA